MLLSRGPRFSFATNGKAPRAGERIAPRVAQRQTCERHMLSLPDESGGTRLEIQSNHLTLLDFEGTFDLGVIQVSRALDFDVRGTL